jgi:endonuclease YncB( thermonuclease family)
MKQLFLFFILFFFISSSTFAQTIPQRIMGKVVKIVDGDTFDLLTTDSSKIRIRLNGIDCPERKQDYYQVCKDALSQYVFGRNVILVTRGRDRWRRVIADVYINNESINYKMVKNGFAWHFKKYSKDKRLAEAEAEARKKEIGLWKMKDPIAPWNQRKRIMKNG